ncbi:MAG TPA: glycosyltransferase family 2 protein [Candidatus Acidoferrum sp.]|nr:glycosyltransferase family 2 protein [Candidatus Acidoferrum sp.]
METLFYYLAILQIAVGLYLVWHGLRWVGYVRRRMKGDPGFNAPRAAVLCPCKGMEPGLERNLLALTEFDYRNYEIFFILASASDSAYGTVKRVADNSKTPAHVVIADRPEGCGEKVHNLRVAIEQLPAEFEVLVFADSDGRPGRFWLRRLVAPLNDKQVGAATTMRWLIPNNHNFATALLAAWNASIVTMLSEKGKNFCWGGGTAIRRSVFDEIRVFDEWYHSVSDDYSMTRALQHAGRSIVFVPECLTPTYVDVDFRSLLEFTNRQVLITKVYSKKNWLSGAATHVLYCLTLPLGLEVTLSNFVVALPAFHLAVLTFLPMLLAAIRGGLRVAAATEVLQTSRAQITGQAWMYIVLGVFIPYLFLLNFVMSLFTRKIRWRGVTYELISPQQTRILVY